VEDGPPKGVGGVSSGVEPLAAVGTAVAAGTLVGETIAGPAEGVAFAGRKVEEGTVGTAVGRGAAVAEGGGVALGSGLGTDVGGAGELAAQICSQVSSGGGVLPSPQTQPSTSPSLRSWSAAPMPA